MINRISKITTLFLLSVIVIVIVVGACFAILRFSDHLPKSSAEITGTIVNNDYNNYLAGGNLVRISDRIYFNYRGSELSYGLIEITPNGSKRIYWEGKKWFGAATLTHRIHQHNGQLVMTLDDQVKHYSGSKGAFEEYAPLNEIPEISLCFQIAGRQLFYETLVEPGRIGSLCVYDGNSTEVIAGPGIQAFYAVGNDIYYYKVNDTGFSGEFRKYSMTSRTDSLVYELDGYDCVFSFIVEKEYIVFGACLLDDSSYSVYKIDLKCADKVMEIVCSGNDLVSDYQFDIRCWNVYNGTIYVASHSGLAAFDLSSNDSRKLYNKYVEECYIIDDTWVYFTDEKSRLWRVTQDGSITEKVF